jgi:hypothetical protein
MSIGGLIADGIGAAATFGAEQVKKSIDEETAELKAKALAKYQQQLKEEDRVKRTGAIESSAKAAAGKRGLIDATPEDKQMAAADYDGNGYDKIVDNKRDAEKTANEVKKIDYAQRNQEIKDKLAEARIVIEGKRLDAMIARFNAMDSKSGGSGSVSDFVQDMVYLKETYPNAKPDELEEKYVRMKRGREPMYEEENSTDEWGNPKTKKTTRTYGKPADAADKPKKVIKWGAVPSGAN